MPYIPKQDRDKFEKLIKESVEALYKHGYAAGSINYYFSSILWKILNINKTYSSANTLIGVLEAIKLEIYRRQIAPYEDLKLAENGDVEV
jgi:hypothetical protein